MTGGLFGTDTGNRDKLGGYSIDKQEIINTWIVVEKIELEKRQTREIVKVKMGLAYWLHIGAKRKAEMIEILSLCGRYHWHYRSERLSVICKVVDCVCAVISHQKNDWFVWVSKLGFSVHPKGG